MNKILLAVIGLLAFAATSQAQFSSLNVPTQTITCPASVAGNSLTNANIPAVTGANGFAYTFTLGTTNSITTNTISVAWRASVDGSATNFGAAIYTNTFLPAAASATNRYYAVVPASAINSSFIHATIHNGNADATNRVKLSEITVMAR